MADYDDRMNQKLDYMYSYHNYDKDRAQVRDRFLKEVNKRVTLEDIGETLDQLTFASKADSYKHYKLSEDYNAYPARASKAFTEAGWNEPFLTQIKEKSPRFLTEPEQVL